MKKITYLLSLLIASMMLSAQNQAPVAVNDTVEPIFGEEFTINFIANDYDPDGDVFGISESSKQTLETKPEVVSVTDSTITFFLAYHNHTFYFYYWLMDEDGNFDMNSFGNVIFPMTESEKYIDVNNISAMIHSFGNHFWDLHENSQFEFPKGSGKTSIFANSLWIGGMDEQGDLHLAAETYRQTGTDYWEGPISQGEEPSISSEVAANWSKIWKINKEEVLYHKEHWNDAGYEMPNVIATWPAHGEPELNQAENIAPFVNIGGDEKYQPELGDYPLIKGDQTLFFVFNDLLYHSETGGDSLGVEIHGMFWAIHDETKPWYENTIFMHYEIYNRSENDYSDMFFGLFTDTDLGNALDDFVQSDVQRSSFIAYNGDEDDNGGPWTYGLNPPSTGVVILGGPKMDEDGIDNSDENCDESINGVGFGDGVVDNERFGMTRFMSYTNGGGSAMGDPSQPLQYVNYLDAIWGDGSHLVYGGDGYQSGIAEPPVECNFMLPADSDPCYWGTNGIVPNYGNWTEEEVGNNPADRRGLQSSGPFTFESGSMEVFDVAYVCAWDTINPYPASVDLLKVYIDSLRADYMANSDDFGYDPALGVENYHVNDLLLEIFPNPTNSTIYITIPPQFTNGQLEVFDLRGRLVISKTQISINSNQVKVDKLPAGFYTLRLIGKEGTYVGKFVKE